MRSDGVSHSVFFGDFELDPVRRQLLRNGEPVALKAKTYDLLELLVEQNGAIVTKNEIFETIWAGQFVEEANLTVQVSALRKALGDSSRSPRYLITVPGKGYKFAVMAETGPRGRVSPPAEAHGEESGTPAMPREAGPSEGSQSAAKSSGRRYLWTALTVAGIVILAAGAFFLTRPGPRPEETDDPRDAGIRQLTTNGRTGLVELSPGGQFFLYTVSIKGEYKNSLRIGQLDGGNDVELLPPDDNLLRGAQFSLDGKTIYFSRADSDLEKGGFYKIPVLGGTPEKISDHIKGRFTLSPDGMQAAYFVNSADRGESGVVVSNLDGSVQRKAATRPYNSRFISRVPTWSADGKLLAAGAIADPVTEREELFVIHLDDGRQEQVTREKWIRMQNYVWQKDGKGLIVIATDEHESMQHLWKVSYPGGEAARISRDTHTHGTALGISDDGGSFITTQIQRESNIWIGPADDISKARQITFSSVNGVYGWFGMDWAPDDRIVFVAGVSRSSSVFSMKSDGTDVRQITSSGYNDRYSKVSPDGRWVVFGSNRGGSNEIWRVGLDGSDLRQLTTGGGNSDPVITPDGKWVVYTSERDLGQPTLWRMPIEGGDAVKISDLIASSARVSPDGTMIACSVSLPDGGGRKAGLLSFADGSLIRTFDVPSSFNPTDGFRWTPDGKAFTYRDWADGVWVQKLNGNLGKLEGLPKEKIYTYDWSPDGKQFAFTRGREMSDAILVTGF